MNKLKRLADWLKSRGLREGYLQADALYKSAISKPSIKALNDWLDNDYSKLSFNELFQGKLRISIPFNTEEERNLIKAISTLRDDGWSPAGRGGLFDVKTVLHKMRRPGGEEYKEEIEVADLRVAKEISKIIPSGPRAGEEVVERKVLTLSKALRNKSSEEMFEWWQDTQSEYTKNYNWKQIETIFQQAPSPEGSSVIISRDPVDVLRMSDHEKIRSCHSEGGAYFECAVAESRGNGLVAYLVNNSDLERLLSQDAGDPSSELMTIDALDKKEIFEDKSRSVSGIRPMSRVRLRKYVHEEDGYEFAAPEHNTYGPHPPGFVGAVRAWAWEAQKDLWHTTKGEILEPGFSPPEMYQLQMHGGSYRDTSDGEVLTSFFQEGDIEGLEFSGNAETISENEMDTFAMWSAEIEEVMTRANAEMKNISFHAEVHGEYEPDAAPYVSASAWLWLNIPYVLPENPVRTLPEGPVWSWEDRALERLLEHPEHGAIEEVTIDEEASVISVSITFNCEECRNPDDVSNYFDYVLRDIDKSYDSYAEKVRRKLVKEGYILEIEYDRLDQRLLDHPFSNFNVYGNDIDQDGETLVSTKPDAFPPLKVPGIFKSTTTDSVSRETISALLKGKPHESTWHKYVLDDSYTSMLVERLNSINVETMRQLHFDFGDGWKPFEEYDVSRLLRKVELTASVPAESISLGISLKLKVSDSKEDLMYMEKFLHNLDKEFGYIIPEVIKAVQENIDKAVLRKEVENQEFKDGVLTAPIINELKKSAQPDVKRLALWIEMNWRNFNNAEREVAYYSFLLPTQRDGDYIHKDELDAPRFWDGIVQKRKDTPFGYRWTGLSMKDVMPYTSPDAEPGKDINYGTPTVAQLEKLFIK